MLSKPFICLTTLAALVAALPAADHPPTFKPCLREEYRLEHPNACEGYHSALPSSTSANTAIHTVTETVTYTPKHHGTEHHGPVMFSQPHKPKPRVSYHHGPIIPDSLSSSATQKPKRQGSGHHGDNTVLIPSPSSAPSPLTPRWDANCAVAEYRVQHYHKCNKHGHHDEPNPEEEEEEEDGGIWDGILVVRDTLSSSTPPPLAPRWNPACADGDYWITHPHECNHGHDYGPGVVMPVAPPGHEYGACWRDCDREGTCKDYCPDVVFTGKENPWYCCQYDCKASKGRNSTSGV